MRRFKARGIGLAAAVAVSAFVPVPAHAGSPAADMSPQAVIACKPATIVGQRKCIAAGQYCQHSSRANRDYHRYGYNCGKRDYRGRYHLTYR